MTSKSALLDRLEGVFILINTFLPALLVALLLLLGSLTWQQTRALLEDYKTSLNRVVASAEVARKEVQKAAQEIAASAKRIKENGEALGDGVDAMVTSLNNTVDNFGNVFASAVKALNLKIAIPVIDQNITLKFGRLLEKPMRSIGNTVSRPFRPLGKSFSQLGHSVEGIRDEVADIALHLQHLNHMDAYLAAVVAEYRQIIAILDQLISIIGRILYWLFLGLAALVAWFFLSYCLWVRRRVLHSLTLLRGQGAVQVASA